MHIQHDPSYKKIHKPDNTVVVKLGRGLYAVQLLKSKHTADSFVENPYDWCKSNKIGEECAISTVLNVDDIMMTFERQDDLKTLLFYMQCVYTVTVTKSKIASY